MRPDRKPLMHLFYAPDILENPFLPEEESAHCVKVLRQQLGDKICLTDGRGFFYKAVIVEANPRHCGVEILESESRINRPNRLYVAVAPTKNLDRMEWLVEKLTEIGIDGIFFLSCHYSERRVLKTDRLLKIAVSAMKQSQRATLPVLGELTAYSHFLDQFRTFDRFICHCYPEAEAGPRSLLNDCCRAGHDALVLIGPEGDFSLEEVNLARSLGYLPVTLGEMRLRTETAALVAGLTLQMKTLYSN